MFKKILFPVDGTDISNKCVDVINDLAAKYSSEVYIFNVQEVTPTMYWINENSALAQPTFDLEKMGNDILEKVAEHFKELPNVKKLTVIGNPAHEILELAEKEGIDIIVMATHGMKASQRFLLGSVTNKVVHHSSIPVLVIK